MLPRITGSFSLRDMTIKRHFLDGITPALHQAVAYLFEYHPPTQPWDLHDLIVAVPGRRAVRRLTELLVASAGDSGLLPPSIVTVGQLPDQLFQSETPIASDLVANLTWIQAARATPELSVLLPHPPDHADLAAWWSLAGQFRDIVADLAAAGLHPFQVPQVCADRDLPLPQPERWHALATVDERQNALLAARGILEAHSARQAAFEDGRSIAKGEVILVGVTDMTPLLADMLRSLHTDITALIDAPEELADSFDDLGAIIIDGWLDRPIEIDDHRLHVVDRPFDQGRQAAVVPASAEEIHL